MPLNFQPSDVGVDPADYAEGEVPVRDASGLFVPGAGGGGADLSDADPLADGTADPGTSVESSRADHVHPSFVVYADVPPASPDPGTMFISKAGSFFDGTGTLLEA